MEVIELSSGIKWHLECMALAANAIDNFRPPADGFQMRTHYSMYLTNLMSVIDLMCEFHGTPFKTALESHLKASRFSGFEVHGYMRELRNGIIHRGIDPTAGGTVVGGITYAIAPPIVKNRSRTRSYAAPANLLRDIFIHCEIATQPIVECFLKPSFEELVSVEPERMLNEATNAIAEAPHMPDCAKDMARDHLKPEMLVKAQAHHIKELRNLLKPWRGQRII